MRPEDPNNRPQAELLGSILSPVLYRILYTRYNGTLFSQQVLFRPPSPKNFFTPPSAANSMIKQSVICMHGSHFVLSTFLFRNPFTQFISRECNTLNYRYPTHFRIQVQWRQGVRCDRRRGQFKPTAHSETPSHGISRECMVAIFSRHSISETPPKKIFLRQVRNCLNHPQPLGCFMKTLQILFNQ